MHAPTISAIKPHDEQQAFYVDVHRIDSPAATRNLVGGYYQEFCRQLFRAAEHQIDSRVDICPDLSVGPRAFLEIKSVGRGRQGLIYQRRLDHDCALVRSGATLSYVFVIHNVEATAFTQREALYDALARGIECVLVIPFERIRRCCHGITPRVMNYRTARSGSQAAREEMPGYRLSWAQLQAMASGRATVRRTVAGTVLGTTVPEVEIRGAVARAFPPLTAAERETANELLFELEMSPLQIIAEEAPRPAHVEHKIRVVTSRNPGWYSRLCASVPNWRKRVRARGYDTGIKRDRVVRSLQRLMEGRCSTPVDWLVRPIVERIAAATAQSEAISP